MGNYPSLGSKGGTVIGALELNICYDVPCCKMCGGPWYNCCECRMCCPGTAKPIGPEWDAAKEGFKPMLDEAATIALKSGGCCFNCFRAKDSLDEDWTKRADEYLGKHGLAVE